LFLFSFIALSNPPLPEIDEAPRLYSNQCQQDLRYIYVNAIRQSCRSIYLVMFGLNDAAILDALSERMDHHIDTKIYYDANESPHIYSKLPKAHLQPVQLSG
jgi:phosphatidylserine/phosphatidylglycerophosphate/cardiolipin synthase-like enzyme